MKADIQSPVLIQWRFLMGSIGFLVSINIICMFMLRGWSRLDLICNLGFFIFFFFLQVFIFNYRFYLGSELRLALSAQRKNALVYGMIYSEETPLIGFHERLGRDYALKMLGVFLICGILVYLEFKGLSSVLLRVRFPVGLSAVIVFLSLTPGVLWFSLFASILGGVLAVGYTLGYGSTESFLFLVGFGVEVIFFGWLQNRLSQFSLLSLKEKWDVATVIGGDWMRTLVIMVLISGITFAFLPKDHRWSFGKKNGKKPSWLSTIQESLGAPVGEMLHLPGFERKKTERKPNPASHREQAIASAESSEGKQTETKSESVENRTASESGGGGLPGKNGESQGSGPASNGGLGSGTGSSGNQSTGDESGGNGSSDTSSGSPSSPGARLGAGSAALPNGIQIHVGTGGAGDGSVQSIIDREAAQKSVDVKEYIEALGQMKSMSEKLPELKVNFQDIQNQAQATRGNEKLKRNGATNTGQDLEKGIHQQPPSLGASLDSEIFKALEKLTPQERETLRKSLEQIQKVAASGDGVSQTISPETLRVWTKVSAQEELKDLSKTLKQVITTGNSESSSQIGRQEIKKTDSASRTEAGNPGEASEKPPMSESTIEQKSDEAEFQTTPKPRSVLEFLIALFEDFFALPSKQAMRLPTLDLLTVLFLHLYRKRKPRVIVHTIGLGKARIPGLPPLPRKPSVTTEQFVRRQEEISARMIETPEAAREIVIEMYNLLLNHYEQTGHAKDPGVTPKEFLNYRSNLDDQRASEMDFVTSTFTRALYGHVAPQKSELERYMKAVQMLGLHMSVPYKVDLAG